MLKIDLTVHPTAIDEKLEVLQQQQQRSKVKKWRFPWRINMLAAPKWPIRKYKPPPDETFKVYGPVDAENAFRDSHLACTFIRKLVENKRIYKHLGPKYQKVISKNIGISWDSIYNYYKRRFREVKLRKLKRKRMKMKAKQPKGKELEKMKSEHQERVAKLATPKKMFFPQKITRPRQPLDEILATVDALAIPTTRIIIPVKDIGKVEKSALTYQITEAILKLHNLPERLKKKPPVIEIGAVTKAALHAQCTPRLEKLAQPSTSAQEAKKQEEDKYDPWIISPTALKYKATERILELAKPLERD